MINDAKSKQAKDAIIQYIDRMARKMGEEDALILNHLYLVTTKGVENERHNTVKKIAEATKLGENATRRALLKLEVACFADRESVSGIHRYAINDDGAYALNYLMNSTLFPGRKEKFSALLSESGKLYCL